MLQDVSEEMEKRHQPNQIIVDRSYYNKSGEHSLKNGVGNGEMKDHENNNKNQNEGQHEASVSHLPDHTTATTTTAAVIVTTAATVTTAVCDVAVLDVDHESSNGQGTHLEVQEGEKDTNNGQDQDQHQDQHQGTNHDQDTNQDKDHTDGQCGGGGDDSGTEKESDSGTMVDDGNAHYRTIT